ncbi:TRAP-type C4-dicarboxylate transport system, small permease component [Natronincola peptidivorans]|uniref:TRAP-type C4-dicarboxylate transport system, small permease component n=1 Tax=Natronincola peptidivorans TaxID=426128 RepID=A0A1I0G649_9FIRM|nr:TRAP transporter small permease [Natronincola peptidivorans]SET66129.1 TRAP-type C4-dicarboxylate transport system, small permease component [Natronincola peptidivorans]
MKRFLDLFNSFLEKIGMLFLLLMLLIVSTQVFARLTIKTTPIWSQEVATMLMVWFGFLGMAIGVNEKIHIAITFFTDRLPVIWKRMIFTIDEFLILFFGIAIVWYGSRLVYATRTSTLPATQWPAYMPYLMVPIAGAMIVLCTLINIADLIKFDSKDRLQKWGFNDDKH